MNASSRISPSGELAVLYCFVFLYIATRGAGRYGVGALFPRRQSRHAL